VGHAIQKVAEDAGFGIVRDWIGHGVGRTVHEDPEVPNYGRRGTGPLIKNGMTIAIEPMINMGSKNIVQERDGWTCRTRDRKPSAHYEHSIAIHHGRPDVLSSFEYVEQVLGERFI
jgi:methionyl aminopeptidase